MAFDPNSAGLSTNVVAGDGVTVAHSTVNGVDTFTAQIDQTWLSNYITTNVGGSLTLSAADEARIAALEAALGTTPSTPDSELPETQSGTTGTTSILATMTDATNGLSANATFTYKLVGIDGAYIASETLNVSNNGTPYTLAWALWANIRGSVQMSKYFTEIAVTDNQCIITWKDSALGSTFEFTSVTTDAADNLQFTVTDY